MSIWAATKIDPLVNRGKKTTLGEAVLSVFNRDSNEAGPAPQFKLDAEAYQPFHDFASKFVGGALQRPGDFIEQDDGSFATVTMPPDLAVKIQEGGLDEAPTETVDAFISWARANGIEVPADIMPSNLAKRRERLVTARESEARMADEVLSRASTSTAIFGSIIGGVGAQFTDPVNLMTLPIGAPARAGLLVKVGLEAGINAGIEAMQTPGRNEYRRTIGQEETSMLENALIGAAFGGAIPLAMRGVSRLKSSSASGLQAAGRFFANTAEKRLAAKAAAESEDPDARVIGEAVLRDIEDESAAVTNPDPATRREHEARGQDAVRAAQTGDPMTVPDRPYLAIPSRSILNGEIEEVDPRGLLVQPDVFQFKSDTVAPGGVTAKLLDNKEWLSERAGVVMVYEYADGTRAIADGFQRTALAIRIMSDDPSKSIRLAARVFREKDGFTVEDIRVSAALKNIAESADGMTTRMATDAAKVLRISPDAIRNLPTGPGIARARELAALADEAFDLVINRVLSPEYAAVIGRMSKDAKMHGPLAKLLVRTEPETIAQAESIISQAMQAPVEREVIADLFGEQEVSESLYIERAKVLERTMRTMREDRQLAKMLTDKSKKVETIGANRLDRESNQALRDTMEMALAKVAALAHRVGPISEALNNAATEYRANGRLGDAAERVRAVVRDEIERNGLSGAGNGGAGRGAESQGSGAAAPDPLEGFGELDGQAVKDQIEATRIEPATPETAATDLVRRIFDTKMGKTKKRLVEISELPPDEAAALHHRLRDRQPFQTIEEAVAVQTANQDSLNKAALDLADGIEGEVIPAKVKSADRILDKLNRKFPGGVPDGAVQRIGDIARVGFTARTAEAADLFLKALTKRFHVVDEGWIVTPVGYFDRKAAIVFDDNSVGELQIWPPGMAAAKKAGGHADYKVWQNPSSTPEARALAEANMKARYAEVAAGLHPSFAEKIGIGAPSRSSVAAASAGEISTVRSSESVSVASSAEPPSGSQAPRNSDIALEPSSATKSPPSLKNRIIVESPAVEATPAGDQLVMPGVAPITARDRLQVKADAPLKARPRGSDTEIGGLFDPNDPSRFDLFDLVPTGRSFDDEGNEIPLVMSRAELAADLDADDEALAVLDICMRGATR